MQTHIVTAEVSIDEVDDTVNAAVAYVVKMQGIVDSVETKSIYLANGKIGLEVSVDYESQPS